MDDAGKGIGLMPRRWSAHAELLFAVTLLLAACHADEPGAGAADRLTDSAVSGSDRADTASYHLVSPVPGATLREGTRYLIRWTAARPGRVNIAVAVGGKDRGHLAMNLAPGIDSLWWEVPRGFVSGFGPLRSDAVRIRIEDAASPAIGVMSEPFTIVADTAATSALPVIRVPRPAVIAFWRVPTSDAELEADPGLASALDEQQYHWAGSREPLERAGFLALDQPGLAFTIEEPGRRWTFRAHADSGEIGYLIVRPGGGARALYRRRFPDEIVAAARSFRATREDTSGPVARGR